MSDFHSDVLQELDRRGLVKDGSDLKGLDAVLVSGVKIAVYAGFDPTAVSLHVGHLATLTVLRVFARHGHTVLPVLGTGTAMIGDPTGRTTARKMLTSDDVNHNAEGVLKSIRLALAGVPAQIVRNGDWIGNANLVWFLREIGARVPLSQLLSQDTVKSRLGDVGISFLEACYPLLQGWDFWEISKSHPVLVQVGGSDQWCNILMGLDLIARAGDADRKAFGLTHPLLLNANGEKMGKTTGGAVWLNPDCLDDYGFYRFWRTLPDVDAPNVARMLSDVDATLVADAETDDGMAAERLKAALAFNMTETIRGTLAAKMAEEASRGRGTVSSGLPMVDATLEEAGDLALLAVKAGLSESKGAARRLAAQGGLRVNGEPRTELSVNAEDIRDGVVILSAGRTRHCAVRFAM